MDRSTAYHVGGATIARRRQLCAFVALGAPMLTLPVHAQPNGTPAAKGVGTTAVAELMAKWLEARGGKDVVYEPVSAGAGIRQLIEGRIDFAAAEQPLSHDDLNKHSIRQFPIAFSAIVPIYNLPGIAGPLRLSGDVLARIYSGTIRSWNDPALAALNPELKLPALPIRAVVRSEAAGTGTNFAFSSYLSKVNDTWQREVGKGLVIKWPAALEPVGVQGTNPSVASVMGTPGSIGYVTLAAAQRANAPVALLRSPVGRFVTANDASIMSAVRIAEWQRHLLDDDPSFDVDLAALPTEQAWPITAATFIMLPKRARDAKQAASLRAVLQFFQWVLESGRGITQASGFVAVDERLAFRIRMAWRVNLQDMAGAPLLRA